MNEPGKPKRKSRRRLVIWAVVIGVLLIPIPYQGIYLPVLFVIFDLANHFLPENF